MSLLHKSILINQSRPRRVKLMFAASGVSLAAVALVAAQSDGTHTPSPAHVHNATQLNVSVHTNKDSVPPPTNPPASSQSTAGTDTNVTSNSNGSSTSVTVNGQPVAVPTNGSTQQTITGPNGNTSVTISNTSSSTTKGSSTNTSVTSTTQSIDNFNSDSFFNSDGGP